MAICAHCKTQETEMYQTGVPVCIACATDNDADRAANPYGKTDGKASSLLEDPKQSG